MTTDLASDPLATEAAELERLRRRLPGQRAAENPPVTSADRDLIRATVGDPDEARIASRSTTCPACGGRGRLNMEGRAVPMATYFTKRTSQPCARCAESGKVTTLSLNELARKWSSGGDLADFAFDPGGVKSYRPSLYIDGRAELLALANAYDAIQVARNDTRRAFRG